METLIPHSFYQLGNRGFPTPSFRVPRGRAGGVSELIYDSQKEALDRWASVVSIKPADGVARSLPTGGRVFVYNLKKPYLDPVSNLPCFQIDVKGVGLTKSGFLQDQKNLAGDERRELMWHPGRKYYFGYENMKRQKEVVRDLKRARHSHLAAPIPLAILELKQMVLDGKAYRIQAFNRELGLDHDEDYGLAIRGYPINATRICDLTGWKGLITPSYIDSLDESETQEIIENLNWARKMWSKYELPKILLAANGKFDANPGLLYFQWLRQSAFAELRKIFSSELSPSTGFENPTAGATHTHLQNHTTANTHVEWTPLSHLRDISLRRPYYHRSTHALEIIEAEHDALANLGVCCLSLKDIYQIPPHPVFFETTYQFLETERIVSQPFLAHLREKRANRGAFSRGDSLREFALKHKYKLSEAS